LHCRRNHSSLNKLKVFIDKQEKRNDLDIF